MGVHEHVPTGLFFLKESDASCALWCCQIPFIWNQNIFKRVEAVEMAARCEEE